MTGDIFSEPGTLFKYSGTLVKNSGTFSKQVGDTFDFHAVSKNIFVPCPSFPVDIDIFVSSISSSSANCEQAFCRIVMVANIRTDIYYN